ncbi:MAG: hypothetical protein OD918_00820 [Gammaproteobacteria bacterium]
MLALQGMATKVTALGLGSGIAWLWLVLVPVSGWLVLKSRFFQRFIWETSGYDRYFLIVSVGIGMLTAGIAISAGVSIWAVQAESMAADIWKFPLDGQEKTASAAIKKLSLAWSAPLAFVLGLLIRGVSLFFWEEKIKKQLLDFLAKKNGMLDFVVRATKKESLTMLTISNRKVYIGWPQRVSDWDNPDPSKQYLYFLPFMSGFRKTDSLEMEITTGYTKPYFALVDNQGDEDDLEILVPVHEIIHVQPFNLDLYEQNPNLFSVDPDGDPAA